MKKTKYQYLLKVGGLNVLIVIGLEKSYPIMNKQSSRNIFDKIPALAFRLAEHKSVWFHSSRGPEDFG
nr:hypothetical protein [Mesobacillus foraminis]